jgi:hypothetical protein
MIYVQPENQLSTIALEKDSLIPFLEFFRFLPSSTCHCSSLSIVTTYSCTCFESGAFVVVSLAFEEIINESNTYPSYLVYLFFSFFLKQYRKLVENKSWYDDLHHLISTLLTYVLG